MLMAEAVTALVPNPDRTSGGSQCCFLGDGQTQAMPVAINLSQGGQGCTCGSEPRDIGDSAGAVFSRAWV